MEMGLLELLMGVETPMPPRMINAAAPGGVPPRRITMVEMCEPNRFRLVFPEHLFYDCSQRIRLQKPRNSGKIFPGIPLIHVKCVVTRTTYLTG